MRTKVQRPAHRRAGAHPGLKELTGRGIGGSSGLRPGHQLDRAPRQVPCSGGVAEFDALGLGGEAMVGADAAVVDTGELGRLGPADGVAGGIGEPAARAGVDASVLDAAEVPRGHRRPWWRRGGNRARHGDVDLVEGGLVAVADGGEFALVVGACEFNVPVAGGGAVVVLGEADSDRGPGPGLSLAGLRLYLAAV